MLLLTPGGVLHGHKGGESVRPALRTSDFEVAEVPLSEARPYVEGWHYARGVGQGTHSFLLRARACGTPLAAAVFNPPSLGAAKFMAQGGHTHQQVLNLSRLCFSPEAPTNSGSFLLARAVRALPERWTVISSYADAAQGVVGVLYSAFNMAYCGQGASRGVWTRDGVQVSTQRGPHTLNSAEMTAEGCVLAGRGALHRYRLVRGTAPAQGPQNYPKPQTRLL